MSELPFLVLIRDELEQVEQLLRRRPPDTYPAITEAIERLVSSGGKRIRPALVLLSARLCGAGLERALFAAAAVEMLHTATLIHDDLIDGATVRRGQSTLNATHSPAETVLIGDYVFAYAAYLASQTESTRLMCRFAETLMVICQGEVRQMLGGRGGSFSFREYEQRIYAKTASLISLAAEAGAILASADERAVQALRLYGKHLGLAFQIVDDVLDFTADEEMLGKPVGSDLRQGLFTLPFLLFIELEAQHPVARRALEGEYAAGRAPLSEAALYEAVQAVAGSKAIEQAMEIADRHIEWAKEALASPALSSCATDARRDYLIALLELADFVVRRRF
ncbi:MAG: polyprenyl synthetase family protein [Anaerolineae bacterium]|nr:polyprenyl synthetase family protein [Anaerolineae bacterium]